MSTSGRPLLKQHFKQHSQCCFQSRWEVVEITFGCCLICCYFVVVRYHVLKQHVFEQHSLFCCFNTFLIIACFSKYPKIRGKWWFEDFVILCIWFCKNVSEILFQSQIIIITKFHIDLKKSSYIRNDHVPCRLYKILKY